MRVHGVGHGRAHRAAARRSTWATPARRMRLMMGLLAPQPFDSTLVGDASLMRRPMERVAVPLRLMGARISTHDGPAAGARSTARRSCARSTTRLPVAERAGEVRGAARRALAPAGARRSPKPRPRAITPSACWPPSASSSTHAGRTHRARGRPGAARDRSRRAGGFLLGGVLPGRRMPRGAGRAHAAQRRRQPDAHRAARAAAAHGRGHPRAAARRGRAGAEPVADIEVRTSALRGITRARGAGAARDR